MVQVGLKDLTEAKFLIGKVLLVSLCCIFYVIFIPVEEKFQFS